MFSITHAIEAVNADPKSEAKKLIRSQPNIVDSNRIPSRRKYKLTNLKGLIRQLY